MSQIPRSVTTGDPSSAGGPQFSRRSLLRMGVLSSVILAAPLAGDTLAEVPPTELPELLLQDLLPDSSGVYMIDAPTLIAASQEVAGIEIMHGGSLVFHPERNVQLSVRCQPMNDGAQPCNRIVFSQGMERIDLEFLTQLGEESWLHIR